LKEVVVFVGHHADKVDDALDEPRVVEIQVDDQILKDFSVKFDQFRELLKQLNVPLNDSLLLLAIADLLILRILLLQPLEDELKLFLLL
jgi:hypothetical protein